MRKKKQKKYNSILPNKYWLVIYNNNEPQNDEILWLKMQNNDPIWSLAHKMKLKLSSKAQKYKTLTNKIYLNFF